MALYDILNAYRVWPKLISLFVGWLGYSTHQWYTSIPDPSNSQEIYASAVVIAVVGFAKFYMETGPVWKGKTLEPGKTD